MSEGSPPQVLTGKKQSPNPDSQKSSTSPMRKSASPKQRSAGSKRGTPERPTSRSKSQSPSKSPSKSPVRGKGSARSRSAQKKNKDGRQTSQSPPKTSRDGRISAQKRQTPNQAELTDDGLKIVDMSGQGMTGIPSSLFTAKDIGELILASNNLRSIPPDIKKLTALTKLDLSRNGLRCSHSQDYGGLPADMEMLTSLQHLKISECNMPFIPPVVWKLTSLKTLDISRNKINILVPDIGNLTALRKVNLQQTNISSLPPEIAYCQELEEILLWGNAVESLPETLPEIPNLKVLAINYRSFCGVIDNYMENLLRKGQIKSEHIPIVVFELPALEVLDLENTMINNVPDLYNTGLLEFYLCHNFLQTLPNTLYGLKHLRVLDLSSNLMTEIPPSIGRLINLQILRANNNSFDMIPDTIGLLFNLEELDLSRNRISQIPKEIETLYKLKKLILEENQLTSLPNEICELTELETLDLTNNLIKQLPMKLYNLSKLTVAHSYRKLQKYGLWLYKNPLEQPPPEIWRTEKPEMIFDYLKKLAIIKTENLQRQKILVLGESQAGKTCLVDTLVYRRSKMTKGPKDKTRVLRQRPWKTDNNVEFMLNDFGGSEIYHVTTPLFLDSKALILLVFNGASFTPSRFHRALGQWIDILNSNAPGAIIKVIATQCDLMDIPESKGGKSEYDREGLVEEVSELLQKYLAKYRKTVADELKEVEKELAEIQIATEKEHYEAENAAIKLLTVRRNKLKEISSSHVQVLPNISVISTSQTLEGIQQLVDELEHLAIDINLFPHAQRVIPAAWGKLCSKLKQQRGNYLLWDQVVEIGKDYNVKDKNLEDCINYLHDIGEVLWYFDVTGLSEILFHKPRILVEIVSSLYRHDIKEFMKKPMNNIFSSKGNLSEEEFEEARKMFLLKGQVCRPFLNCLWFYQNMDNYTLEDLLELLPLLDLCYSVPEPDVPTCRLYIRPLMVIPWYNKDDGNVSELSELWTENVESHHKELSVVYSFPFHFPKSLFEKMVSSIQDLVLERIDWCDCVYAESDNEKVLMIKTVDSVKLFVRGPDFHSIQELATEFIQIINSMLIRYPGLYWTLNIPMKSPEFLSHVATSPCVRFESAGRHMRVSSHLTESTCSRPGTDSSKSFVFK